MNRKPRLIIYLVSDILSCLIAWTAFYFYRESIITFSGNVTIDINRFSQLYFTGLYLFPFYWLLIYFFSGYYTDVFRKSRLVEFWLTLGNTIFGATIVFLTFINKNPGIIISKGPLAAYFSLLLFHFTATSIPRLVITSITNYQVHKGKIGFNTLLIGGQMKAVEVWNEMTGQKRSNGNKFVGYVQINSANQNELEKHLPCLGQLKDVHNIIHERNVVEVIIAIEPNEGNMFDVIIKKLINEDVEIKAVPSLYDFLTGKVHINSLLGTPLISVSHNPMPLWQQKVKLSLDYLIAALALLITLPVSLALIMGIKLTSKGPVFYSHERIGRYGKPFRIYKFRSMYVGAEKNGPELSSKEDSRITPFGRFMRRSRLDEIPNFINVLKGDMSIVGPRPERKYYIDKIVESAPHYLHLLKVKPGITSWGQVKFGYAENVNQMKKRLKYDLLYLDNMSLIVDFRIIIFTILTILKRKGI